MEGRGKKIIGKSSGVTVRKGGGIGTGKPVGRPVGSSFRRTTK